MEHLMLWRWRQPYGSPSAWKRLKNVPSPTNELKIFGMRRTNDKDNSNDNDDDIAVAVVEDEYEDINFDIMSCVQQSGFKSNFEWKEFSDFTLTFFSYFGSGIGAVCLRLCFACYPPSRPFPMPLYVSVCDLLSFVRAHKIGKISRHFGFGERTLNSTIETAVEKGGLKRIRDENTKYVHTVRITKEYKIGNEWTEEVRRESLRVFVRWEDAIVKTGVCVKNATKIEKEKLSARWKRLRRKCFFGQVETSIVVITKARKYVVLDCFLIFSLSILAFAATIVINTIYLALHAIVHAVNVCSPRTHGCRLHRLKHRNI